MKTLAWLPLAAALIASAAFAQTPTPTQPPASQPAPVAPMAPSVTPAEPSTTGAVRTQDANAPLAGSNSFTEAQAKARIEDHGFSGVGQLQKDKDGIWRTTATKDGKSVNVALDYRGNVVGQ